MSINMIRQGDVLLIRRPEPSKKNRLDSKGLRVPGERTGHTHMLETEVFETERGNMLFIGETGALMTHDEHGTIPVPAGWWEPRIQREFSPTSRPISRARFD